MNGPDVVACGDSYLVAQTVPDSAEAERRRDVLIEIPGPAVDVRPAVVDRRGDAAPAVAEAHLGATRKTAVGDSEAGVEPTCGVAGVVVPRGNALVAVDGQRAG